jgi:hypothetical protein
MPMASAANRPVNEIRNEFWSSFIHSQRAAIQKRAVQRHNCCLCVADFAHFYESESAGVAGVPIYYDGGTLHHSVSGEQAPQLSFGNSWIEVSHKNICHGLGSISL